MSGIFFDEFDSPIGVIRVEVNAQGELLQVTLKNTAKQPAFYYRTDRDSNLTAPVRSQLCEYLSGKRKSFSLPLKPEGTPFQMSVWHELLKIPYGTTTTYAAITAAIGYTRAYRAVGHAVGANPIFIIIPCHRVIGSSGKLTGFAYGLDIKRFLLGREGLTINS